VGAFVNDLDMSSIGRGREEDQGKCIAEEEQEKETWFTRWISPKVSTVFAKSSSDKVKGRPKRRKYGLVYGARTSV